MREQLRFMLRASVFVGSMFAVAQAQLTPDPLYDFRASDNEGHPDFFANLGTLGGELGVQGTAPVLENDTFDYYHVREANGSFDILTGSDGVVIEDGFSYEMLLRRNGDGFGSEDQISAIAEGGGKKIFLGDASNGVNMLLFSEGAGGEVREIGAPDIFDLPAGEWTHFIITFDDATDLGKVYVNGGAPSNIDFTGIELNADPANDVSIFKTRGSEAGDRRFDGDISETRLYDFVLSDEQARANYDATVGEVVFPPSRVGPRGETGSLDVNGSLANLNFTEPGGGPLPGLAQSWYGVNNPGSKAGVDAIARDNDRIVPYFHGEEGTWWTGSADAFDVQKYPADFDGLLATDNFLGEGYDRYSVKLEGEILIEESGTIRFLDGVDDYTYFAIDLDRNGVAGDSDGEVLLDDDNWTDVLAQANDDDGPPPIVEVNFEDIAEGGEWLAMEFYAAEGEGGDAGVLYWDYQDEDDLFPLAQGDGLQSEQDIGLLLVPDTHLRGPETPAEVTSGEVTGTVPSRAIGWEIDVNPADGSSDTFVLANLGEGRDEIDADSLTTILDVNGVELHVNPLGEVSEGDSFQVFLADIITGTPVIATEGWSFDRATGSLVFGAAPSLAGDINGDGKVDFPDFLILSDNFGKMVDANTDGDLNGDGDVAFADFLILSDNFGSSAAASVPEPSGLALLCGTGMLFGWMRRRRK